ncbi:MAG: 4Fe-4S binding protein [Methanotrichaceae archaeon]|nr:4Fe-4S binding protein [Methanotrichaceae archaeon]
MPVYVDVLRCIGCKACEVACKREHNGKPHIAVLPAEGRAAVPLLCHHCKDATCALVCYSGALTTDGDRVSFDAAKCTGCGICALACPFGVIWSDKLAHKCDLCYPAELPSCVATCPAQALSTDYDVVSRRVRYKAAQASVIEGKRSI